MQSELVANESMPPMTKDPRAAAALAEPLVSESYDSSGLRAILGAPHTLERPADGRRDGAPRRGAGRPRVQLRGVPRPGTDAGRPPTSAPGKPLRILKLIAYGWSAQRSAPALRDQVAAAAAGAIHIGWDGLLAQQRAYLDDFWDRADVEIEGDPELQQAIRFGLFHTLQAGARGEQRAIAAKGLTGPGYDGHTFWDTEMYVLPVLTYTAPHAAADALALAPRNARSRPRAGPHARPEGRRVPVADDPRPGVLELLAGGHGGVSHQRRHRRAPSRGISGPPDDPEFERNIGLELLVETARLWRSLGHHDATGAFRIDGVTGPDEYRAVADNNVYTNLMAQRNLRAAADAVERHPTRAARARASTPRRRRAGATPPTRWSSSTTRRSRSTRRPRASPTTRCGTSPAPSPTSTRCCCTSRTSTCTASRWSSRPTWCWRCSWCGDSFTPEEKARDFDYYEPLTVRDSSLSACTQAIIAAEVGQLDLAYDYFAEAALMDLDDLEHNTRDGIHIASVAGTWIAAVAGFGGMRDHGGRLTFAPRLPGALTRLRFRIMFRERSLQVEVDHEHARYTLRAGDPLEIEHHGEPVTLTADKVLKRPIPRLARQPPPPPQPPGREPARRRPSPQPGD